MLEQDKVIAYIYDNEGFRTPPIILENTPDNIAAFVARGTDVPKIEITNIASDEIEIETYGNVVTYSKDPHYLIDFLYPELAPMQNNEINPYSINIKFELEDCIDLIEFKHYLIEKYNFRL